MSPGLPPKIEDINPMMKAAYKPTSGGKPAKIANDSDSGIIVMATVRPARISVLTSTFLLKSNKRNWAFKLIVWKVERGLRPDKHYDMP